MHFSYNDECDGYYYYNTKTKVCQWQHPLDAEYKHLVEKARKSSGQATNDLSEVNYFFILKKFHSFSMISMFCNVFPFSLL